MSDARLVFVTGAPRSGTTFVSDWLCESPDAYCAHEVLPLPNGGADDDAALIATLRRCALTGEDRLGKPRQREFMRWRPQPPKPAPAVLGLKEPVQWPLDLLPGPLDALLERRRPSLVVLVRHPYDTIASGRRRALTTGNWPGFDLDSHCRLWLDALSLGERARSRGQPVLTLRQEELLREPEPARAALERLLGVELPGFDGNERTSTELTAMRERVSPTAGLVDGPDRELLPDADRRRIVELTGEACGALGYEL